MCSYRGWGVHQVAKKSFQGKYTTGVLYGDVSGVRHTAKTGCGSERGDPSKLSGLQKSLRNRDGWLFNEVQQKWILPDCWTGVKSIDQMTKDVALCLIRFTGDVG